MASTLNRALDWLVARPWISQSAIGLLWIFFAIAALGKGQGFAVELAFWGMLIWALTEDDKRAYMRLLDETVAICEDLLKMAGEKESK